jgi:hypothetical protein
MKGQARRPASLAPKKSIRLIEKTGLYHGTAQGVRIYSKSDSAFPELPRSLDPDTQSDSRLPFFRGESLIEGNWRISDVLASIVSIGARSIWDERFKRSESAVVAILSDTDHLIHTTVHAGFPVGERDSVQACSVVQPNSNSGFYVSCSVEDPAVPLGKLLRNHVSLGGWALRYRDLDEDSDDETPEILEDDTPTRKGRHNKTLSRIYEPRKLTPSRVWWELNSAQSRIPCPLFLVDPSSRQQTSPLQLQQPDLL